MESGGYLSWQLRQGPKWIVQTGVTFEQALYQFFSVDIMVKTLFAHWHKDAVAYRGSLSSRLLAFAWNGISRGIGFIIRLLMISVWSVSAVLLALFITMVFTLFVLWPIVAGGLITTGTLLLIYG